MCPAEIRERFAEASSVITGWMPVSAAGEAEIHQGRILLPGGNLNF